MKKFGKWVAGLTASLLLVGSFAGCTKTAKQDFIKAENLVEKASCVTNEGKKSAKGALKAGAGASLTVTFPQETAVNTVVLEEKGNHILAFKIEALVDGVYQMIYEQDKVEAYRYCAFPEVKTTGLKLTVLKVREDKTFDLRSMAAYNVKNDASSSTRVTAYVVGDRVYDKKNLDAGHFDTITDVILFGLTSFDEKGAVIFNEVEIDGQKLGGQQVFEQALKNIREISNAKKTPLNIYVNLLGPNPQESTGDWNKDMDLKADIHAKAMVENQEKLISGISDLVLKYQLDGVFFDYEYPIKKSQWTMFGDFLIQLKAKLGTKKLGTALAAWGVSLSKQAIDSIDMVEVMTYDSFDKPDGNHSPFYSCAPQAVDFFVKKGFDRAKLDLGIPFYARPADGGAFWYDYSSEAHKLGKFGNMATGKAREAEDKCETRFYNGYQMTYDKTAYAVNAGVGGVMVWHYSCDLPADDGLSLFGAIGKAITERK